MTTDAALVRAGDTLPDITLPRLDAAPFSFGSLRGKRVLLFFWGSW